MVGDRWSEKATDLYLSDLHLETRSEVLYNEKTRLTLGAKRVILNVVSERGFELIDAPSFLLEVRKTKKTT